MTGGGVSWSAPGWVGVSDGKYSFFLARKAAYNKIQAKTGVCSTGATPRQLFLGSLLPSAGSAPSRLRRLADG